MRILGIDEAGRGPVIGPLVIAGFMIEESKQKNLRNLGVKDSKLLTPLQREDLFEKLQNIGYYRILVIGPKEIDDALRSDSLNLNWLEAQQSSIIINELKPDRAILDCPSTNLEKYKQYMQNIVYGNAELIVEHKADLNHLTVAAASILAKVTRDNAIREIEKKVGQRIGSGYPSDPYTQSFIRDNYKRFPEIFRKTWASYKRLIVNQSNLDNFQSQCI